MTRTAAVVLVLAVSVLPGVAWGYATDAEVTAALATFRKDYASKDESDRERAVKELGAVKHKRVVEALGSALARDPSLIVKRHAAAEIGAQWSPNAVTTLARALRPDDPGLKDVNTAIIKALGATSSDEAVPTLVGLLTKKAAGRSSPPSGAPGSSDEPPSYTLVALKALEQIASPRAMDDVLLFLVSMGRRGGRGSDDEFGKAAEDVLTAITGEHVKGTNEWNMWWNENKATKKVIPVYRCEGTGQTFDKLDSKSSCPHDGEKNARCGFLLKTKLEGGGKAPSARTGSDKPDRKDKKDKKKDEKDKQD